MLYIGFYRENVKKIFLSETTRPRALIFGPRWEKTCLRRFANNTGADQPAHPPSQISALVIWFFERIISKLATSEISNFLIVSVAWKTGLSLAFSKNPRRGHLVCSIT